MRLVTIALLVAASASVALGYSGAAVSVFDVQPSDVPGPQPITVFPVPAAANMAGAMLLYNSSTALQLSTDYLDAGHVYWASMPLTNANITINALGYNYGGNPPTVTGVTNTFDPYQGLYTNRDGVPADNRFPAHIPRVGRYAGMDFTALQFDLTYLAEQFGVYVATNSNAWQFPWTDDGTSTGTPIDDDNNLTIPVGRQLWVAVLGASDDFTTAQYEQILVAGMYAPFIKVTWNGTDKIKSVCVIQDAGVENGAPYGFFDPYWKGSQPEVSFNAASSSSNISTATVYIPVSLDRAYPVAVTVDYAATGGTAATPDDYAITGTSLTFNPGERIKSIPITVVNTATPGPDKTIIVTLTNPQNAALGTNTAHTHTITNNNPAPTAQFTATSSSGNQTVTTVNLQVSLSGPSGDTITVDYAVTGGTAASPSDYTIAGTSLTFNPGQTTRNIPITVVNTATPGPSKTITVTLSNPQHATLGTNTAHTYTITNSNPAPAVQFTATSSSGNRSVTSVNLAVSLSGPSNSAITVNYSVTGGTAASPADYTISGTSLTFTPGQTTGNIPITVVNTTAPGPNKTIIVTLSNPASATLGTNTAHTYTIINNNLGPTVQFTAASSSGNRSATTVNLQVSLSGPSSYPVTVDYAVTGGTAASPDDYAIAGTSLAFSPGQTTRNVPITVVNTATPGPDKTIIVTLSNPACTTLGTNTAHTYTITNNNPAPTIQFATSSSSGNQSSTPANLAVSLSGPSEYTITVNYAVTGGTAVAPGEYTTPGSSLTFAPGETTGNIPITIVDTNAPGSNKTVIVTLSSPQYATLGTRTNHTYTIINDNSLANQAPIVYAGSDVTIAWPTITVQLSGMVSDDGLPNPPGHATVTWTADSAGVTFADAHAANTTATFAGAGTYTLQLVATDGQLTSAASTMTVTVTRTGCGEGVLGPSLVIFCTFLTWRLMGTTGKPVRRRRA